VIRQTCELLAPLPKLNQPAPNVVPDILGACGPTRASAADQHSGQVGHSHSVSVTRARVSCRPQSVVISLPEGKFR